MQGLIKMANGDGYSWKDIQIHAYDAKTQTFECVTEGSKVNLPRIYIIFEVILRQ